MTKNVLKQIVWELWQGLYPLSITEEEGAERLRLKGQMLTSYFQAVRALVKEGRLVKHTDDTYSARMESKVVEGIYKAYSPTFGFVLVPAASPDIYIHELNKGSAMNNDKVRVELLHQHQGRYEGRIIEVVERANTFVVGTFDLQRDWGFVTPDEERLTEDIAIPLSETKGARTSARVLVEITKWPTAMKKAEGKVVEILGYSGDKDLDIRIVMAKHQIPFAFPEEVEEECKKIDATITMTKERKDFQDREIITIDGEDAKDLDDAVEVEILENGNYRLGVHIADVSYYVKKNTAIDKEAYSRGTSTYLIDRVIPMLPKVLSNGICSLNAHEPRYAMSCIMEIDKKGQVCAYEITPSVIEVKRRCNYAEVRKALEEGIMPADLETFYPLLLRLKELALVLKQMRNKRGAVDFEFPEYKILLDEEGIPKRIVKKERSIAEQMIEECMLIANETVASHLEKTGYPSIYRIHEHPSEEKLQTLQQVLRTFNKEIDIDKVEPRDFQQLVQEVKGTELESVVQIMVLRSMQQAEYNTLNQGHFGLASTCYTHFTSPIRRYPDLLVHRLLRQYHSGQPVDEEKMEAYLQQAAEKSSERERLSAEAERDTEDMKRAEYMKPYVGEVFEGQISSVMNFGMFVTLDNGIEGLVHISTMVDDEYIYDELSYRMVGVRSGKSYRLGDTVTVTLAQVDLQRYEIDFVLGKIENLNDVQALMEKRKALRRKKESKKPSKGRKEKESRKGDKKKRKSPKKGQKMTNKEKKKRKVGRVKHGKRGKGNSRK